MVRGRRRSYSCVVWFLRMQGAMGGDMWMFLTKCLASVQLASQSRRLWPTVFATMNQTKNMNKSSRNKHCLLDRPRSLNWRLCPPLALEARNCQFTGSCLEKRTILPGFRKATLVGNILRKIALQERWTKETVSVAAIFSRRCSRVEKTQAFEDGLTDFL